MASKESTLMIFKGYFAFLDSSKQIAIHMAWMLIQCRSNSHGQNVRDDFYVLYILVYLIWDGAIIVNFFLILKGPVRDMYKVKAIKTTGIIILNTVSQRTQIVKHYCLHLTKWLHTWLKRKKQNIFYESRVVRCLESSNSWYKILKNTFGV